MSNSGNSDTNFSHLEKANQPKLMFDKKLWNEILFPLIRAVAKELPALPQS